MITSRNWLLNNHIVFAELFEPTLTASLRSLRKVIDEVVLQDSRANNLEQSLIVEKVI